MLTYYSLRCILSLVYDKKPPLCSLPLCGALSNIGPLMQAMQGCLISRLFTANEEAPWRPKVAAVAALEAEIEALVAAPALLC